MKRLSPGECGEGQFGVVPVPGVDGFLHYYAPDWAPTLANGGILFIDEINTAPPGTIQAALLGLVQLRILGSHQFDRRVRTIAAANEVIDAAGGWDLPPALCNRFGHLSVSGLEADDWADAYLGGFRAQEEAQLDAVAEEARVAVAWPSADAKARGYIAGFIRRRPDSIHVQPSKGSKIRSWASRRSVEYAGCALAAGEVHGLTESETDELVGAFVGNAWVGEFRTWVDNADLPDPAALLDGAATYKHDDRRIDRTIAVLGACAALVAPKEAAKRKARAGVLWTLCGKLLEQATDAVIPTCRVLINAGLLGQVVPESKPVLNVVHPILEAAGVRRVLPVQP